EAWACLAALTVFEDQIAGTSTRPETLRRAREAVRRALEIDSTCQRAWHISAFASFLARDASGVRIGGQRAIELNALDTAELARAAIRLTGAGDLERAGQLARTAISYHGNVAGWYYYPLSVLRYIARDYPEALEHAKRGYSESFRPGALALAIAA